jgi:PAS domain S-box-containing protein
MDQQVFASLHSPQRLAALQQSQLLNPAFAAAQQQVLRLLARTLDVPIALLLILDADRERLHSSVGLREQWKDLSSPLEASFSTLLLSTQALMVADTLSDPITHDHATIHQLGLGAIAAVAVRSSDEQLLGALVAAHEHHHVWTDDQVILLKEFAELVHLQSYAHRDLHQEIQYAARMRFQAQLVDHVEQAVIATNAEGNITYWNPFAEKLYGWAAHEILGRPIVDIIPMPVPKEQMLASIARLAEGQHDRAEIELRRRDGTLFPAMVAVSPVREADGSIIGIVGVSADISDRKHMEAELRERERRYRTISDLTSDYVYSIQVDVDGSTRSLWATRAFVRITGYTREEVQAIGGWQGLIHPDDMPSAYERQHLLLQGQADVRDLRIVTKQGETRWIRDYAAPEWDEQQQRIVSIIGAAQDITERKQAEQALREAEVRYRSLVERIPAITYITSLDEPHRTLYISPQVEHILGFPISDWLSGRDLWAEQLHPEDRERMYQLIQDASLHHKPFKAEYRMIGRDGRIHWFRDESVLVQSQAQGRSVLQGVAFDITEQKRAEADRLAFERTLLESQKRESLGVLAGGVAHDFNNLLLVILGNAALAQLDVPEQSPTYATITEIQHAAERAANLVQQLLAYTGKGRLVIQQLNLGALLEHMQPLLRSSLPSNVQLNVDIRNNTPLVEADESQIRQVITNLVLNAAEAIKEQQGRITITIHRMCATSCLKQRNGIPRRQP